jgi:phycoerythrin-associated linker protein
MTIQEFLNLTVGQWFAQRTSYILDKEEVENSKAEITTEILPWDQPEVIQLCQQHNINPEKTLGAIKSSWDNSVDWDKPKEKGTSVLVFAPDENQINQGLVLRNLEMGKPQAGVAHYLLTEDGVLTLSIQEDNVIIEERQWFASDNLRLRNTVVTQENNCTQTAFYSEIRKIVAPPKE